MEKLHMDSNSPVKDTEIKSVEPPLSASDYQGGSPSTLENEKRLLRQQMILMELLETERNYVNDLNILVKSYLDPLNHIYLASVASSVASKGETTIKAAEIVQHKTFGNEGTSGWITFDQKHIIIRNAAALLRVQKLILKMMEDALGPQGSGGGGLASDAAILQLVEMFNNMMFKIETVYIPYCSQHDLAIDALAQIKRTNPNQLHQFLDEQKQLSNSRLEIQDYLIKPVQRICKYPLLLQEIVKTVRLEDIQILIPLQECLGKIKELVHNINEKKKILENEKKKDIILQRISASSMNQIQQLADHYNVKMTASDKKLSLNPSVRQQLATKFDRLIRGSGLYILTPTDLENKDATSGLYRGAFLFRDFLLVIQPKRQTSYQIVGYIFLSNIEKVQELDPTEAVSIDPNDDSFQYGWRIVFKQVHTGILFSKTEMIAHQFGAKSRKEKEAWLSEFERLVPSKVERVNTATETEGDSSLLPSSPTSDPGSMLNAFSTAAAAFKHPLSDDETTDALTIENRSPIEDSFGRPRHSNNQPQVDYKLNDVYTTESAVLNKNISGLAQLKHSITGESTPQSVAALSRTASTQRRTESKKTSIRPMTVAGSSSIQNSLDSKDTVSETIAVLSKSTASAFVIPHSVTESVEESIIQPPTTPNQSHHHSQNSVSSATFGKGMSLLGRSLSLSKKKANDSGTGSQPEMSHAEVERSSSLLSRLALSRKGNKNGRSSDEKTSPLSNSDPALLNDDQNSKSKSRILKVFTRNSRPKSEIISSSSSNSLAREPSPNEIETAENPLLPELKSISRFSINDKLGQQDQESGTSTEETTQKDVASINTDPKPATKPAHRDGNVAPESSPPGAVPNQSGKPSSVYSVESETNSPASRRFQPQPPAVPSPSVRRTIKIRRTNVQSYAGDVKSDTDSISSNHDIELTKEGSPRTKDGYLIEHQRIVHENPVPPSLPSPTTTGADFRRRRLSMSSNGEHVSVPSHFVVEHQ